MSIEEKLVNDSRTLIERIRESAKSGSPDGRNVEYSRRRTATWTPEEPVDGSVELSISKDRMTAFASFYPPQNSGQPLETSVVYQQLAAMNVIHGIQREAIESALFTCNTERSTLHEVEVAFGTRPQDAVPAHLQPASVSTTNSENRDDQPNARERVNYRERSSLHLVHEGDVVAEVIPAREGADGMTVTGEEVPCRTVGVRSLRCGGNVVESDSDVRAAMSGVLHVERGLISVSPTLTLSSGVDYHTGNVNFEGDVILGGGVGDGFTIRCTGALVAKQTLDASGITCGSLMCAQGLIGRNEEPTVVTDDARVRFVQNARLMVGGSLSISQSVLKAHVTASDSIKLGSGSTVVASILRASLGVSAHTIGAPGAAISEIYIGIDFEVDERLATIRDQTVALSEKLRDVRMARTHGHDTKELEKLEVDIESAISMLSDQASELVTRLDRNEEAALIVRGTIHAGTYIEICHRSYIVQSTVAYRRFRLDKAHGAIVCEPLQRREG